VCAALDSKEISGQATCVLHLSRICTSMLDHRDRALVTWLCDRVSYPRRSQGRSECRARGEAKGTVTGCTTRGEAKDRSSVVPEVKPRALWQSVSRVFNPRQSQGQIERVCNLRRSQGQSKCIIRGEAKGRVFNPRRGQGQSVLRVFNPR